MQLSKLQDNNKEAKALKSDIAGFLKNLKDDKRVLQYEGFLYVSEIIYSKLINHYYKFLLIGYFEIDKIQELIDWRYYWTTFRYDIETYVRDCKVY